MANKVNIVLSRVDGDVIAAVLSIKDGKLVIDAAPKFKGLKENILAFCAIDDGYAEVNCEEEPEKWLRLLPRNIRGSYMRAVAVAPSEGEVKAQPIDTVLTVFEDDVEIGFLDLQNLTADTEDEALVDLFAQAVDEGIPVEVDSTTIRYERMTVANLISFLQGAGYTAKTT